MNSAMSAPIRFVLFATGVTAIGGFLFGYDTAVINGANSYLRAYMHLSPAQEGIAGASAILGCIPGAMCAGFLSDRFGRKRMLFLCALLYAVSGVLSSIPRTFDEFLVARFISGLGIGASSIICPVYIAEISPEQWRGRLGSLFQLGIVTGIFVTLFVNKVIQGLGDEAWNTASGWRWMLGMEVVPAMAFIGCYWQFPRARAGSLKRGARPGARHSRESGRPSTPRENWPRFVARWFTRREDFPSCSRTILQAHGNRGGFDGLFAVFAGSTRSMYYSTKIFRRCGCGERTRPSPRRFGWG
jgi:SP family arabinose:H+ symporter-like MFS transporter